MTPHLDPMWLDLGLSESPTYRSGADRSHQPGFNHCLAQSRMTPQYTLQAILFGRLTGRSHHLGPLQTLDLLRTPRSRHIVQTT